MAPQSPWQNPCCERVIGSIRRDALDHVIVLNERHLRRVLQTYVDYDHHWRTHLSLEMDAPESRAVRHPSSERSGNGPQSAVCTIIATGRPRGGRWEIGPSGERHKERDVWSLLRFLLMVLLSMVVWIAIGLGVGVLLPGLIPSIDLGMGTLIGVVALGGCFLWLSRISTLEALYGYDALQGPTLHGQRRLGLS